MKKGSKHSSDSIKKMREIKTGKKASLITKMRMSEAKKGEKNNFYGRKHTDKSKRKISENNSGENFSLERRKRLSQLHKGTHIPLEIRKKISESSKGEKNHFYGKKHTLETKRKISDFRKTVKLTDEHKRKIAESLKGEKCYLWRGGISFEPYGLAFNKELREQIRARDFYRCQECFKHESELFSKNGKPEKLSVHHCDYDKQNNRPSNLISLCKKCHCKTNYKRKDWTKYFQKKLKALQLHRIFVKKTLPNQF